LDHRKKWLNIVRYDFIDLLHLLAPRVYSLAASDFKFDQVKDQSRGWGWETTEDFPDVGVLRFLVDDTHEVVFDSAKSGGLSGRAFVWAAVCYWPEDEDCHPAEDQRVRRGGGSDADSDSERGEFDAKFEALCEELTNLLGAPTGQGKYEYAHRPDWPYHYAVWRARHGFLILQQDELDIAFGFDISLWAVAARDGEALPSFPLNAPSPKGDSSAPASTIHPLWDRELDR
jgi:hypothetical protein